MESKRLLFQYQREERLDEAEVEHLVLRLCTKEGTQYYPPSFFVETPEGAKEFLRDRWEEEGDTFFVTRGGTSDRIGMVGILPSSEDEEREAAGENGKSESERKERRKRWRAIEIAYMFVKEEWGKGYATEAVGWMIDFIRSQDWYNKDVAIFANTHPDNAASHNVLINNGFVKNDEPSSSEKHKYVYIKN